MHREGEGWDSLERGAEGVVLLLLLGHSWVSNVPPSLGSVTDPALQRSDPPWPQTLSWVSAGSLDTLRGFCNSWDMAGSFQASLICPEPML